MPCCKGDTYGTLAMVMLPVSCETDGAARQQFIPSKDRGRCTYGAGCTVAAIKNLPVSDTPASKR